MIINYKSIRTFLLMMSVLFLIAGINYVISERKERKRLEANFYALSKPLKYMYDSQGRLIANSQVMQLKVTELKELYPDIMQDIKNLQVKPARTISYSGSVIESEKHITTLLRDSLITDTLFAKVFAYKDPWYEVKGIAIADTQHVLISSIDTLVQVIYRGGRIKPLLWIFSPRRIEQNILSKNPSNKIIYNKTILLTKNKIK